MASGQPDDIECNRSGKEAEREHNQHRVNRMAKQLRLTFHKRLRIGKRLLLKDLVAGIRTQVVDAGSKEAQDRGLPWAAST